MTLLCSRDTAPGLRGIFKIRVKNRQGETVLADEDNNLIVNGAKTALAILAGEQDRPDKTISYFGVGTGTNAPAPPDESLTDAYLRAVDAHDFPEPGVVRFVWSLGYGEANGMAISEFGLFCGDKTLFARKVRDPISKADDLCFEGEWSIIF